MRAGWGRGMPGRNSPPPCRPHAQLSQQGGGKAWVGLRCTRPQALSLRTVPPPLPCAPDDVLPGKLEVVARGNAMGKGPVLFCLPAEGVAAIKRLAAQGDERFAQLELDMYRMAGARGGGCGGRAGGRGSGGK